MQNIFIGRQPIIDSNSHLCAYEIIYEGTQEAINRYSSASIINNVLNKFGTHTLLGDRRAFVKIDVKFLMHDIIFSIPGEFFIFSILSNIELNDKVIERIEKLHDKGYLISIDDFKLTADEMYRYEPILDKIDFVKIDIKNSTEFNPQGIIEKLKQRAITVVAFNVEDFLIYEEALGVGCDWFQGYFFAEPKIIKNEKFEPSHMAVLKLYNLLMQDVNIDEITKEFELNYEITVQLLQFINSGAFHFRNKIASIHHVLTLVGRIPLGQWLMLMIYSKSVSKEGHSPLMLMVKYRTELMENILKAIEPNAGSNMLGEAYFVGVLSLIDTVFGVELKTILEQINISENIKFAVLDDAGKLGEIFHLVREIEQFNPYAIVDFEKKHALTAGSIEKIAVQAMRDVNSFENPEAPL